MAVYTPTAVALGTSLTIPADGETIEAVDVNAPLQAIADGVAYLGQTISVVRSFGILDNCPRGSDAIAPNWSPAASPSQWAPISDSSANAVLAARAVYYTDYDGLRFYSASTSVLARHIMVPINDYLIHGATLTDVRVTVKGSAGHALLPSGPLIGVFRLRPVNSSIVSLVAAGLTGDTVITTAAYEVAHDLFCTPNQNNTIDLGYNGYQYYAMLVNEYGAYALAQLQATNMIVAMTAPRFQT